MLRKEEKNDINKNHSKKREKQPECNTILNKKQPYYNKDKNRHKHFLSKKQEKQLQNT